jgi:hypothetical protein
MARVISGTKAGITADWADEAAMRGFLEDAWALFCKGGVPATEGNIEKYSRESTAKELARLLDSIV